MVLYVPLRLVRKLFIGIGSLNSAIRFVQNLLRLLEKWFDLFNELSFITVILFLLVEIFDVLRKNLQ